MADSRAEEEPNDDLMLKTMLTMESIKKLKYSPDTLRRSEQAPSSRVTNSITVKNFASIDRLPITTSKKTSLKRKRVKKHSGRESPRKTTALGGRGSFSKGSFKGFEGGLPVYLMGNTNQHHNQ